MSGPRPAPAPGPGTAAPDGGGAGHAIEIVAVTKRYGRTVALGGVDLDIDPGEFVVLLGPSGCGKSTLLKLIAGLEDLTDGEIYIGGRLANYLRPSARDVAMVFQNYALYPHMTVRQNLGFPLKMQKLDKAEVAARVDAAAALLQIGGELERYPDELSGGQRQRVALGRAIVREPLVFLMDEPLSNLDALLRVQMRTELLRLHKRVGRTTIYVTHDQVEAMTMADRVVVMRNGLIQQVGRPGDVYRRPANRFVATFVGSPPMNIVDGRIASHDGLRRFEGPFSLDLPELAGADVPDGEISLGVRPEDLAIVPPSTVGAIPATIDLIEIVGADAYLSAAVGPATILTVRVDAESEVREGDHVDLRLVPRSGRLFRADGSRIVLPGEPR